MDSIWDNYLIELEGIEYVGKTEVTSGDPMLILEAIVRGFDVFSPSESEEIFWTNGRRHSGGGYGDGFGEGRGSHCVGNGDGCGFGTGSGGRWLGRRVC